MIKNKIYITIEIGFLKYMYCLYISIKIRRQFNRKVFTSGITSYVTKYLLKFNRLYIQYYNKYFVRVCSYFYNALRFTVIHLP